MSTVLVTVGSTHFDALIRVVDSEEVAAVLAARGYTRLLIQKGCGSYLPTVLCPAGEGEHRHSTGLTIRFFDYLPSLAETISSADLVISHAGSGSIFESLSAGRKLVVVPNPKLMDNHQVELAEKLASMNHLVVSAPDNLLATLRIMDLETLQPYCHGQPQRVADAISAVMGF